MEIEYRAFHDSVGLVDMSSMGIFELQVRKTKIFLDNIRLISLFLYNDDNNDIML